MKSISSDLNVKHGHIEMFIFEFRLTINPVPTVSNYNY